MNVQLSCTLIDTHRLSSALINFEHGKTLDESRGWEFYTLFERVLSTLMHSQQLSTLIDSRALSLILNVVKLWMRVGESPGWEFYTLVELSCNTHSRLTARMRVEQNFHSNLVTWLSYNSHICLTRTYKLFNNLSTAIPLPNFHSMPFYKAPKVFTQNWVWCGDRRKERGATLKVCVCVGGGGGERGWPVTQSRGPENAFSQRSYSL